MVDRLLLTVLALTLLGSCGGGGSTANDRSDFTGISSGSESKNAEPLFLSATSFSIVENNSHVGNIEIDDEDEDDALTLSIANGLDSQLFELGNCGLLRCTQNTLSFKEMPNFELPRDVNGDNIYEVAFSAFDGDVSVTQNVSVIVTNAVEGRVVDAPLVGSKVCIDQNENWKCDVKLIDADCVEIFPPSLGCFAEPSGSSDINGYYSVEEGENFPDLQLRVLSLGGVDILTDKNFSSLALLANISAHSAHPIALTPLSTMLSVATQPDVVLSALGFPNSLTPDLIFRVDPWGIASESEESSQYFPNASALAKDLGVSEEEIKSFADNILKISFQIANLIRVADAIVVDTVMVGLQTEEERAAMITSIVMAKLIQAIYSKIQSLDGPASSVVNLGSTSVTAEVLQNTAQQSVIFILGDAGIVGEILQETTSESAASIVEDIFTKQISGGLDLSNANDPATAAILEIKEVLEVIEQGGLGFSLTENLNAIATTVANTNTLIESEVSGGGVAVLTTVEAAEEVADIVTNVSILAEQLIAGQITLEEFYQLSDVSAQAAQSGGLNEIVAGLSGGGGEDVLLIFDDVQIGDADLTENDVSSHKQKVYAEGAYVTSEDGIGREFTASFYYRTDPISVATTGLGIKIFFDSEWLEFLNLRVDLSQDLLQATASPGDTIDDIQNMDGDLNTDKFILIAYTSFDGEFNPPQASLFSVRFKVADTPFSGGGTTIGVALDSAAGFLGESSDLNISFQ